jgi:hypothetical protein
MHIYMTIQNIVTIMENIYMYMNRNNVYCIETDKY